VSKEFLLTEDKNKGTVRVSEVSVFGLMVERNRIFGGKGLVFIDEFEIIPGT
jgi:hypothetical protein